MTEEKLRLTQGRLYNILDKPDGQECLSKVAYGTAYGATFGTIVSLYDVVAYTRAKTPSMTVATGLGRWMYHLFPMAAVGGTYTAVACISGSMRGKDGPLNHFIAGLAAGGVYGVKMKSQKVGWGVGLGLGLLGCMIKTMHQAGFQFVRAPVPIERNMFGYQRAIFTTRPDPEGKAEY